MYLVLYTDMDIEHQEQVYMKYLIDDLEEVGLLSVPYAGTQKKKSVVSQSV